MHQKRAKWLRWLETIKTQLYAVMGSRLVFRETFRIITQNPTLPQRSLVYHHLQIWYADHAVMAVRRQIKSDRDAVSLLRLLQEIEKDGHLVTRTDWLASRDDARNDAGALRTWARVAGAAATSLPPSVVAADIATLRQSVAEVERFADKRIAHDDHGGNADTPTYDQLNASLDRIDELFRKYYLLLVGRNVASTTPMISGDWMTVYDQAWRSR